MTAPRFAVPPIERILRRVVVDQGTDCWRVQMHHDKGGYTQIRVGDRFLRSHRVAYESMVGPIPEGMEIDHTCNTPDCVNPEHLEPVTAEENNRRKLSRRSECRRGHGYTEANTYWDPRGRRGCRQCNSEAVRRYNSRRQP